MGLCSGPHLNAAAQQQQQYQNQETGVEWLKSQQRSQMPGQAVKRTWKYALTSLRKLGYTSEDASTSTSAAKHFQSIAASKVMFDLEMACKVSLCLHQALTKARALAWLPLPLEVHWTRQLQMAAAKLAAAACCKGCLPARALSMKACPVPR